MSAKSPAYNLLYIAFVAVILLGDAISIPIPVRPMPYVKDMYDTINALPAGTYIWWDVTGWPYSYYTALYSSVPILRHIAQKNLKFVGYGGAGPQVTMHDKILSKAFGVISMKDYPGYGTTYVDLGIPPGTAVGATLGIVPMMQLATGWKNLVVVDMFGTPLDQLELTKPGNFDAGNKAKVIFQNNVAMYATFMPAGTKYVTVYSSSTGVVYDTVNNWYAGLLSGFVAGIKQGGQYELLTGIPGDSSKLLLAETFAGAFVIAGMIIGNLFYLMDRARRKGQVQVRTKEAAKR
jgi:hypothetical protein